MDEKTVMRIAKFYDDTRTWRGEQQLAGCYVEAGLRHFQEGHILTIGNEHRKIGWEVTQEWWEVGRAGFKVRNYRGAQHDPGADENGYHYFDTAQEVMDWLSERLRDG